MFNLKNYFLPIGFSVPILLMVSLVFIGLQSMAEIQNRLKQITKNNNIKISLVTNMRYAARERTISLYRMVTLEDPFDRDDSFMYFISQGAKFGNARKALLKMTLTTFEKSILDEQSKLTIDAVTSQDKIIDMSNEENMRGAIELLYSVAVPKQNAVFTSLNKLLSFQQEANRTAAEEAEKEYHLAKQVIIIFSTIAILIVIIIAIFVIWYKYMAEKKLYKEKQKAEVTLHSISDGVITTNVSGEVEYLNPIAEEITGWNSKDASGLPLLEVFHILDFHGKKINKNPVLIAILKSKIVDTDNHFLYNNFDKKRYSLEHTVGPMLDNTDTVVGAVLIFRNITDLRDIELKKMAHQATHDSLTGLINRSEFESRLTFALRSARIDNKEHILCYLDLDQFKIVNDTCGHVAGDELLKQIVELMKNNLRKSDTLARLGGDEFGILLLDCPLENAKLVAEKLRQSIKDFRFSWDDNSFVVGASFGLVEITPDCGTITDLLSAADSACYVSKDLGRDRIHVYKEDDEQVAQRQGEMQWVSKIQEALENDRFCLYCQNILKLNNANENEIHYEILVRMISPEGDITPPMAFIPSAERYHLMPGIDRWVIEATLIFLNQNRDKLLSENQTWSINLSGQSICENDFLNFIIQQIDVHDIDPHFLCFEITETAAVKNLSRANEFITKLKEIGCRFSLDDFGSGLSSFTYLKNLPVDYIKIDGSFVKDMIDDPIDLAMVKSINQIGHTMKLKTIAEFVENEEILEQLREIGIDYAQGYGIHVPQLLEDVFKDFHQQK